VLSTVLVVQRVFIRLDGDGGYGRQFMVLYDEGFPLGTVAPQFSNVQEHGGFVISITCQCERHGKASVSLSRCRGSSIKSRMGGLTDRLRGHHRKGEPAQPILPVFGPTKFTDQFGTVPTIAVAYG
jgi:hypothetical protein